MDTANHTVIRGEDSQNYEAALRTGKANQRRECHFCLNSAARTLYRGQIGLGILYVYPSPILCPKTYAFRPAASRTPARKLIVRRIVRHQINDIPVASSMR